MPGENAAGRRTALVTRLRPPPTSVAFAAPIRRIHLGLSLLISLQLACSLAMQAPAPGVDATPLAALLFRGHRWIGLAALLPILSQWLYVSKDPTGLGRHLFPWTRADRGAVAADVRTLLGGAMLEGGARPGLPGLIHGLGLLAASAMVLTGAALFFGYPASGPIPPWVENVADAHSFLANFMWTYAGGHVGMVLLHHLAGGDELRRMFRMTNPPAP